MRDVAIALSGVLVGALLNHLLVGVLVYAVTSIAPEGLLGFFIEMSSPPSNAQQTCAEEVADSTTIRG
jgi:hypothetical protein